MVIKYTAQGFTYLYGPLETELVKNNYLLSNDFSVTEETLVYPPKLFLIGRKQVVLKNERNQKDFNALIELIFNKKGFIVSKITLDLVLEDYQTISSDLFSFEDSFYVFKKIGLQEISLRLTENILGKPYSEMFFDVNLQSDYFLEYCKKYGIEQTENVTTVSLSSHVSVSDWDNWEKINKIEMEKTEGGSILKKTVILPNFDHTILSVNPDIHMLISSNIIMYANDDIIDNTYNLVSGIRYQIFGLNFLKNNLLNIKTDFLQLRTYYKNPSYGHLSWVYLDKSLTSLENKFEDLISTLELEFLDVDDPNYFNYQNLSFKEKLNELLDYNSIKSQYLEVKKHLQDDLSSLRNKVSDKGEKEEKMAYDRIVAVIGFLASFQVVSEILPLFSSNIVVYIRVLFLIILVPLLLIIWYITSYNNKNKIKLARKLEYKSKLAKQKQLLVYNLIYFKQASFQELLELSKNEIDKEITLLEEKLKEIDQELIKIGEE